MSLILPKSSGVSVSVDYNGKKEKIELDTMIAEIAPNLTCPTILELIANTSAVDTSKFADIEYRALAKTKPTVTYKNGKYVVDPKNLEYKNIEVTPVRLTPIEIADKISLRGIDIAAGQGWERVLATNIINFTDEIRVDNEILAFNNLAYAAQQTQAKIVEAHTDATTFLKGAHIEKKNLLTPDDVYNSLSQAKTIIRNIGKENAKTAFDANFKFAKGINLTDVVCVINEQVLDLLLAKNGVFASDAGFDVFKNLRIRNVLGIDVIPSSNLPDGVNFLMFTTGKMGAIAFNKVGINDWFKFSCDPEWELDQRLHCARQQVLGVVYETLIIGSFNEDVTINYMDKYSSVNASNRSAIVPETFDLNDKKEFKKAVKDYKKQLEEEAQKQKTEVVSNNETNNIEQK